MEGGGADLEFQDFPLTSTQEGEGGNTGSTGFGGGDHFGHAPDRFDSGRHDLLGSAEEGRGDAGDGGDEVKPPPDPAPPLWSLAYYQYFFDVDTREVGNRLLRATIPFRGNSFVDAINRRPDLWGPFWISTTLIFVMAISGNFASYMASESEWQYDFKKVTLGAMLVYGYVTLVPTLVWSVSRFVLDSDLQLLEAVCLYGYAIGVFIPISVLCVIHSEALRWVLVLGGTLLSAAVLLVNVYPFVKHVHKPAAKGLLVAILLCHVALAVGFKLYFFEYTINAAAARAVASAGAALTGVAAAAATDMPEAHRGKKHNKNKGTKRRKQ